MRILQIRFKNLNSLVGEWNIDFTHPAFASDGIFAITGPTGAGKTTILDAICLSLYGRTPRLSKVTKSGNEIMSRHTGECFAEVTFETQSGRFRCHWSQHRARRKPDGELQAPRHEIADADSGQIFEVKLRGVAEQIETATGMDFNRFTRSMLLAQGGFAAFLQAAPDERAPILEQITGTEIYSRISMRVHERRSAERNKLDMLSAELAGMQLLSEEDEGRLNADLAQKLLQETELSRAVVQKKTAVDWLDGLAALEQELQQIEARKHDWQTRDAAFAPERKKLHCAVRALELAGQHAGLTELRRAQEADGRSRGECLKALPEREAVLKASVEAFQRAVENLDKKKAEQKEARVVLRKTLELDLKIKEKEAPVKTAGDAAAEQEKTLEEIRAALEEDRKVLGQHTKELEAVRKHLADTGADEGLVEHLAGIRSRLDALKTLHDQRHTKTQDLKTAELRHSDAARHSGKQSEGLKARKRECETIRSALGQKQRELNAILEDRGLAEWRSSRSDLKERKALLENISDAVRSHSEAGRVLDELDRRHDALTAKRTDLAAMLQRRNQQHETLEREMLLLETQFALLKKIQDFEEARHQLLDGQPCPLCGATEHPFARGNIPTPDQTAAALDKARADVKAAYDAVADAKIKQAETVKELEQIADRKKEFGDKCTTLEAKINQGLQTLAIEAGGREPGQFLPQLQRQTEDALNKAAAVVQAAEALEKEVENRRVSLEKATQAVAQSEREAQNAAHQAEMASQSVDRQMKELCALDEQLDKARRELRQELAVYGIERVTPDDLDSVRRELTVRRQQWLVRQEKKTELQQRVAALEIQTRHRQEEIKTAQKELKNQQDLLKRLQDDLKDLHENRRALFGDKRPDEEEARLSAAVEAAEKDLEKARQARDAAARELAGLKSRIEELEKSIAARAAQLQTAEADFAIRLGQFGFAEEAGYTAACLPEGERRQLADKDRKLADEQTGLAAAEQEKKARLEAERRKQVTDQSREALGLILSGLEDNLRGIQQSIGAIRQKLKENERLKQTQQERSGAVEAQKRECARWDRLHELIGSADGKKYRNFAQGLTFEMMIGHANRQLQKMTDRYLLVRDDAQPLELNVIDNYQAGEIRSTKNLSGGESFIVSLSLALGLSHMASKNVRVDSLFLDEGFGSLDEEALDTALETLAGLQRDGKLIGVISHVPALKERIGTQIQVIPRTGGTSVISGPGCSRPGAATGA
jgi:exonuclease SbcC